MNKTFFSLLLIALLLTGCVTKKEPLYVWGNYSYTSSAYGMYGNSEDNLEKHIQELDKIINESKTKGNRVAPGIYAEYGQLLYETGNKDEAKKYLLLEKQTYPESQIFVDRVLVKLYRTNK